MNKYLNYISLSIVEIIVKNRTKRKKQVFSYKMEKELSSLKPGKDSKNLIYQYYFDKIRQIVTLIHVISIVIIFILINQKMRSNIKESYFLKRNNYDEGNWNIKLDAEVGDENKYNINVEVAEQIYSKQEAEEKIDELITVLPKLILGNNESLLHITKSLNLMTTLEEYPFTIRWESNNFSIIQDDGSFGNKDASLTGEEITLKAIISYYDIEKETFIYIRVFPMKLSITEEKIKMLERKVDEMQKKTKEKEFLELPNELMGEKIVWKEKERTEPIILIILMILMLIGIWIGKDNDIEKKYKERNKQLLLQYSEFVSKLQLLIGCGMTIRGALEKMGDDYHERINKNGERKYVYEELLLVIRKLKDGVSESECYDYFGKRCNLLNYKKLSSLLAQNLRKGTDGLLYALSNETKIAFEERKQQAKRIGEEAQTKLLFPMILMLSIIMIIIMIPAYLSFGGL